MVQIVGNLEWELLKNVEISKIYIRPYHKHSIRGPPFREFRPRKITYFLVWKLRRLLGNIIFQTLYKIHIDSGVFCIK